MKLHVCLHRPLFFCFLWNLYQLEKFEFFILHSISFTSFSMKIIFFLKDKINYLSHSVSIDNLENFIETKLAKPLCRVANGCWCPSFGQFFHTAFLDSQSEPIDDTSIFLGVDLDTTLHQIKGDHCCVCDTTAENSTKTTQGIVFAGSKFTAYFLLKKIMAKFQNATITELRSMTENLDTSICIFLIEGNWYKLSFI